MFNTSFCPKSNHLSESMNGKSVSWMKNNDSVMRFYNNGSEKTWRFRFIQQLGIQLEKQISLIKGII